MRELARWRGGARNDALALRLRRRAQTPGSIPLSSHAERSQRRPVQRFGARRGPRAATGGLIAVDAKAVRTSFQKITELMTPYGPVAIYFAVALAAALLFTGLPGLMARRKPNAVKSEAYECGVEPTSDVSGRFPVRFYLIAMLFVVFDVEAASFYPWAVQMHQLRVFGLLEMIVFVVVLAIGYAYVWKRGGFQWR
jgi:NADH-quinone oxidoreductase subunit A